MSGKPQTLAEQIKAKEGPQYRVLKTCKGCCHFKSGYWREQSGDGETYDSGTYADCLKVGRNICSYYGDEPSPPDWCPCAALEPDPTPALGWRAMHTAAAEKIKANPAPCRPASGWTDNSNEWYELGQLDAAASFEHAILAMTGPSDEQALAEAVKLAAVQELVKTAKWIGVVAQTTGGTAGHDLDLIKAIDGLAAALAKIGGAA